MHDPMTVAHEIYLGPKKKKDGRYSSPIITIWHVDPEKDGTDDSCGWFIRSRHIDPAIIKKITSDFRFEFEQHTWFNEGGYPKFSTSGITLDMYSKAYWAMLVLRFPDNHNRRRKLHDRFMRKHLHNILHFAENGTDSLHSYINMKYGVEKEEERLKEFVSIISADVMRKIRPWWQHPKWHLHHWKIQFHPWQRLKRRYWDKCCKCGKRGFKGSACGDWDGTKIWHSECDTTLNNPPHPNKQ